MKHDLKLRDLRSLQELLDDLEWETELIGEETDYPSLAAVLPVEEDCDERAVFTYILPVFLRKTPMRHETCTLAFAI